MVLRGVGRDETDVGVDDDDDGYRWPLAEGAESGARSGVVATRAGANNINRGDHISNNSNCYVIECGGAKTPPLQCSDRTRIMETLRLAVSTTTLTHHGLLFRPRRLQ